MPDHTYCAQHLTVAETILIVRDIDCVIRLMRRAHAVCGKHNEAHFSDRLTPRQ